MPAMEMSRFLYTLHDALGLQYCTRNELGNFFIKSKCSKCSKKYADFDAPILMRSLQNHELLRAAEAQPVIAEESQATMFARPARVEHVHTQKLARIPTVEDFTMFLIELGTGCVCITSTSSGDVSANLWIPFLISSP